MKVRVDGIYDLRTVKSSALMGIGSFCFDLNPTSLNFVQIYRIQEIIEAYPDCNFTLGFGDEKEFVVKSILDQLKHVRSNILIEFSCESYPEFMNNINFPLSLKVNADSSLNGWSKNSYLKQLVFDYSYLDDLNTQKRLSVYLSNIYSMLGQRIYSDDFSIGISNYPFSMKNDIYEMLDCDFLTYRLSSNDEVCYRNIDLKKLKDGISSLQIM